MAVRAYYRVDLARSQLETALSLFVQAKDFASVITLAGAAEEVFGKLLTASGSDNSLESLKQAVAEIQQHLGYGEPDAPWQIAERANRAKNSLKHWNRGDSLIVRFDLEVEARDLLNRASTTTGCWKQN